MSKLNFSLYEGFQSNVDSAYSQTGLRDSLNYYDDESDYESDYGYTEPIDNYYMGGKEPNLWDFLGLGNLRKDQKTCAFDCAENTADCLATCEQSDNPNKKPCNLMCAKEHGINCIESCLNKPIPTPPIQPTQPIPTYPAKKPLKQVPGLYYSNSNYAPYGDDIYPSYHKNGWDINQIDNINNTKKDEVITVNINTTLFPFRTNKPLLEF